MTGSICLYEGKKNAVSSLPPTPKLLHLAEFIETIISRNGASAVGALLGWVLPSRVVLGSSPVSVVILSLPIYYWQSNFPIKGSYTCSLFREGATGRMGK